jgi:tetratricopeptide (TPR) repeat protein
MDRYYRALRVAVETHGGTVVKLLGDGVIAAFGVPRVAEDDALRAVRAAVAMQRAFRTLAAEQAAAVGELGLRVGVNTGEVVVSEGNDDVVGDPVNVAARLQQEAHDGAVLIGESTRRLVSELVTLAPFGVLSLKGRSETVAAYRIVSLERPAGAAATAFVGRDDELRRVMAVYDAAVAAPAARLAVVLGSPGLGKSRLLDEVARRLGDGAAVVSAQCEQAGGATFAPIAKAVRELLGVGRAERTDPSDPSGDPLRASLIAALSAIPDRDRIADGIAALLAGTPASPEETFFVVRRFLAALAATRPVVLAIDDLQWAEPLLLDLVEHLIQWSKDVPLLVLAAARPELRDARSSLASPGGFVSEVVTLAGLDAAAATRLAANVIGAEALPAAVAGRVLATSEGNPLFVGELVRMLVNDGALKREGDRWTAAVDLAAHDMPPTIHALLAARIERLRPEDRTVLERAAVIGRQFSRTAVAHLLPREITDLDARLESLRRSEVIEPDSSWFLGEPALRFHHGLTRDAAYRRVLKGTRADLHARLAEWIEAKVGESIEHDETLGWHFEQAHQHLRELGPIDAHGRALGERAARYLAAAGRRALARDDLSPAANLLGRALDRLDAADPTRADLTLDWCEALLSAGDVGPATKAIAELARFIDRPTPDPNPQPPAPNPHLSAWHTCFVGQLAVLTDPQALRATADAVAAAAEEFAASGDALGEAKAHSVHALALQRLGKIGACEATLDKALAAARRADDRRRSNAVLAGAPLAALWGPSPVTRASGRCLDVVRVLRITQGAPAVEAVALRCQAVLEALRGRTEAARRMIASSRRMVEELGITQGLLEADMFAGLIELIEGDAAAAERSLQTAYDGFRTRGLGIDAARAAALLGRALFARGQVAEAEALSHESEALAGDDLQAAIAWRRVRAETLAASGEHTAAVHVARAAVDIAGATDALLLHADARLALAVALRAAGRRGEADAEEARAIELWEAKGASLLAERARHATRSPLPPGEGEGRRDETPRLDRPHPNPLPGGEGAERKRRRVRPNAATAHAARVVAAMAARDADALPTLLADRMETVHHPTGVTFDREGNLTSLRVLLDSQGLTFQLDPLATLGDSLALCRHPVSASAAGVEETDIGAFEQEQILLIEVDEQGRARRTEFFAADRLGDAVARLYERYAELLPDGPARTQGAATARSVTVLVRPPDLDRYATAIAPALEYVDRRTLGMGSAHGAKAYMRGLRVMLEVADDIATRVDDILALRADALLVRWTQSGTERAGGGAFERDLLRLLVFGTDGLLAHHEQFDTDRDDEALARFDELTGEPTSPRHSRVGGNPSEGLDARLRGHDEDFGTPEMPVRRRVGSNAATASLASYAATVPGRDLEALTTLIADDIEVVHHPYGLAYGREEGLNRFRLLFQTEDLAISYEPLAVLGDWLGLARDVTSFTRFADNNLDFGASRSSYVNLFEVNDRGKTKRVEIFAVDHLGDAIARLYERYAELLPDGPARTRAATTARSIAALLGAFDLDRWATAVVPDLDVLDHRHIGLEPSRGAETWLRGLRALLEVAEDLVNRVDDVLALRSNALLVRWTNFGRARVGGGAYERHFLWLGFFGSDGLQTHLELFEPDRANEALARFDELGGSSVDRREGEPPGEPWNERSGSAGASPSQTGLWSRNAEKAVRRVRPNAATVNAARFEAAMAARDADAFPPLFADDMEGVHHPTGATYDRRRALTACHAVLRATDVRFAYETLATLGDSLALSRLSVSASGVSGGSFDLGAYETEEIVLIEADEQGRRRRNEFFAIDHLSDGVARLYERYAELLPDGPARARAVATARSVAALVGPPDLDRYASALAPAVEFVDNRTIGFASGRGADKLLRGFRSLLEMAVDVTTRVDDILCLESDALLAGWTTSGIDRTSGGAFESHFLLLWVFGPDGRVIHDETFDAERVEQALARFDELVLGDPSEYPLSKGRTKEGSPPTPRIENAATRAIDRLNDAWEAHDWKRLAALFPADFRGSDRRRMVQLDLDRDQYLEFIRMLFEISWSRPESEVLATRGARLALYRIRVEGSDRSIGPSEIDSLGVIEVDEQGERLATVRFDVDDFDAAYAEVDARYEAGEAAPYGPTPTRMRAFAQAIAVRDWDGLAARHAPDLVVTDHRPLGWETMRGPAAFIESLKALVDLAPDVRLRADHVIVSKRRDLAVGTLHGTREGGAFEDSRVVVAELDAQGRTCRLDFYTLDQLDEARAHFEALGARVIDNLGSTLRDGPEKMGPPQGERKLSSRDNNQTVRPEEPPSSGGVSKGVLATPSLAGRDPLRIPPNAATRASDRIQQTFDARDSDVLRAQCAPTMVFDDRRRRVLLKGDRDLFIASNRVIASNEPHLSRTLLATAGDQLALYRLRWTGATVDVGAFESENLSLIEVDAEGRITAIVAFDPDDRRAASMEMLDRDPRRDAVQRAMGDHDLDRLRAALPADFVFDDHRPTGLGRLGRDDYVASLAVLFEQTPDVIIETLYTIATERHRNLIMGHMFGRLVDGGEFESVFVRIASFSGDRIAAIEVFEIEDFEVARARFEELGGIVSKNPSVSPLGKGRTEEGSTDPLRIPPNAATRARDRWLTCIEARDWDALRALCAPIVWEDRRRLTRATGDCSIAIANSQLVAEGKVRVSRTLLATAGDRLALDRTLYTAGDERAPAEIEVLLLMEVDAEGRVVAAIGFDPDDRRAASVEMVERYAGSDAGRWMPLKSVEFRRAVAEHDLDGVRAAIPDDFFFHDHRRTGGGLIEGADAYVAWLGALFEQSPDALVEALYYVVTAPHGFLAVGHTIGTNTSGGEFESVFVQLGLSHGERLVGAELFEIEGLDVARARFEELRPDPLRIPPNAATRASDRWQQVGEAQDWNALEALYAPTCGYDDRRRFTRTSGDRAMHIANTQYIFSQRARAVRTLVATSGERLAIEHVRWTGRDDAPVFEIDLLSLTEVDTEGRILARILFDPDDRRAASVEMVERYAGSDAGRWMPLKSEEFRRALAEHDIAGLRAAVLDDFCFHDHRRTGAGRIEGADAYVAWLGALFEQSPDALIEPLYYVATEPHGFLAVAHTIGTNTSGGEFESVFIQLGLSQGAQLAGAELFEIEDLDIARARFEELRESSPSQAVDNPSVSPLSKRRTKEGSTDPLRIPPNAAMRANARHFEFIATRDWPAYRALTSSDFTFGDRRKRSLVSGDVELFIKNLEVVASWHISRRTVEPIATVGDRIALDRIAFAGDYDGGTFEGEFLRLTEVDADGRLRAVIHFDLDDGRAAFAEAQARFAAGEASVIGGQAPITALIRAIGRRDWQALSNVLAPDAAICDRRALAIMGEVSGAQWVESLRTLADLAPDMDWELIRILTWNRHGRVGVGRLFGTTRDGGPFENAFVAVLLTSGDHVQRYEFFDIGDADRAVARFEELCAEPPSRAR